MTPIAKLMDWNGTVEVCRSDDRWFDFPKKVLSSVRFGTHDFVMGETMQIIPVRKEERVKKVLLPAKAQRRSSRFATVPEECLRNVRSWFSV